MKTARILSSGQGMSLICINGSDFAAHDMENLFGHPVGYEAPRFNAAGLPVITDPKTAIGNTGWSYGDAVEEVIASGGDVDLELFPFASTIVASDSPVILADGRPVYFSQEEQFEHETGWSIADALDEALEAQRERKLFGRRH